MSDYEILSTFLPARDAVHGRDILLNVAAVSNIPIFEDTMTNDNQATNRNMPDYSALVAKIEALELALERTNELQNQLLARLSSRQVLYEPEPYEFDHHTEEPTIGINELVATENLTSETVLVEPTVHSLPVEDQVIPIQDTVENEIFKDIYLKLKQRYGTTETFTASKSRNCMFRTENRPEINDWVGQLEKIVLDGLLEKVPMKKGVIAYRVIE